MMSTIISRHFSKKFATIFYRRDIEFIKTTNPKPIPTANFGFGNYVSDHMLEVHWSSTQGWSKPKILPVHNFTISPFNKSLQHGIGSIDGFSAYRTIDGHITLHRPFRNATRFIKSSEEVCFPSFDQLEFVRCIEELVKMEQKWVPPFPSSLFIRPIMFTLESGLIPYPPKDIVLCVLASPMDPPYEPKPAKLWVESVGSRSRAGGAGHAYIPANYAIGMKHVKKAAEQGYEHVLWADGDGYLTETSTCNFFMHWITPKNVTELLTPIGKNTVLPGVTKDTIFSFAQEDKRLLVRNGKVSIQELIKAGKEKRIYEAFICGTEAGVIPISSMMCDSYEILLRKPEGEISHKLRKKLEDVKVNFMEGETIISRV